MARPKSISNDQILDAAREVFLEEGIQGTTSKIAERAGISEGTIYRRFDTKHALFMAAMDIPNPPGWAQTLEEIQGEGDLEANLNRLALEMISFFEEVIPKVHMVMSCRVGPEDALQGEEESPPVRGLKMLTGFFHRERNDGRLRPCDPEIVARMLIGSVYHFAFSEVAGLNDFLPMPRETYVRGVVRNLLQGIAPDSPD